MKFNYYTLVIVALVAVMSSCSTPKNIAYFQSGAPASVADVKDVLDIRVRPEDKLSIVVSAQDPELAMLFNLMQTQNRIGQTAARNSATVYQDGRTSMYSVDSKGDIEFPVLGKLHVAGMKREEVAEYICRQIQDRDLIKEPVVTVDFVNTGVNIIGEVASPGRYEFNRDRLSIIDAIAMAGDLRVNGMRENVKVMRETEPGKREIYVLDLTDLESLTKSPAYYLQQNDVVYVEPNDKAKREATPSGNTLFTPSFWLTLTSMGITIATFIITLSK